MTGSERKDNLLLTYTAGLIDQEIVVRMNVKEMILKNLPVPIWPFCPPPGATVLQGAAVIRSALLGDPANNHEELILIARRAFAKAWECTPAQLAQ